MLNSKFNHLKRRIQKSSCNLSTCSFFFKTAPSLAKRATTLIMMKHQAIIQGTTSYLKKTPCSFIQFKFLRFVQKNFIFFFMLVKQYFKYEFNLEVTYFHVIGPRGSEKLIPLHGRSSQSIFGSNEVLGVKNTKVPQLLKKIF